MIYSYQKQETAGKFKKKKKNKQMLLFLLEMEVGLGHSEPGFCWGGSFDWRASGKSVEYALECTLSPPPFLLVQTVQSAITAISQYRNRFHF